MLEQAWRRKCQPTPVFLPGEFHGQRSLAGDSPWGHRVTTERLTPSRCFSPRAPVIWKLPLSKTKWIFFFLRQSLEDFCFQATFSKFNLLSVDSLLGKVSYVASSLPNSPFCCYFYSEVVCNIYILYP